MYHVTNAEGDEVVLSLISKSSARDALACFYLFDSEEREVVAESGAGGKAFLIRCPNPFDPLRPVVIARASPPDRVKPLITGVLDLGQEHVFVVTPELTEALRQCLQIRMETTCTIFAVTRDSFRPRPARGERLHVERGDPLKYSVLRGDEVVSSAGVLWASARFAELFVFTGRSDRGKGYGVAVASACTAYCLDKGLTPLYIPQDSDGDTITVCRSLGYKPTGDRDYTCVGQVFGRQRAN